MKLNVILDLGHGGINPQGVYVTPGKRATLKNGKTIYEGVVNRIMGSYLGKHLKSLGLDVKYTVLPTDYRDISLKDRAKFANSFNPKNTIFVSIHNNAANTKARGFEIYTSVGKTNSDVLATLIGNKVKKLFDNVGLKLRFDFSDGDLDKEANFYVLKYTKCPAILIEGLFFDNDDDAYYLENETFINVFTKYIAEGILEYSKLMNFDK